MSRTSRPALVATLQALLVTFLWSTSFVLIKVGLRDLGALSFAGLRYFAAFVALAAVWIARGGHRSLGSLSRGGWLRLALLGLLYYTLTQGAQFLALVHLPAVTVSLLLSASALLVALLSPLMLREPPSAWQWAGIGLYVVGVAAYFWPLRFPAGSAVGMAIALVAVLANALSSVLGRSVNRDLGADALTVTVLSMGMGGTVLLVGGLAVEGLPVLSPAHWGMLAYLSLVSGAAAFALWNHTLRTLTATRSSLLNNTMLFQIGVLAWVFLGEAMSPQGIVGAIVASIGVAMAQVGGRSRGPGVAMAGAPPPCRRSPGRP